VGRYHVVTLVERIDSGYLVWDTNGMTGCITDGELQTGFLYPDVSSGGTQYRSPYMVIHPELDCILLRGR
jgi:hypothetical protein